MDPGIISLVFGIYIIAYLVKTATVILNKEWKEAFVYLFLGFLVILMFEAPGILLLVILVAYPVACWWCK